MRSRAAFEKSLCRQQLVSTGIVDREKRLRLEQERDDEEVHASWLSMSLWFPHDANLGANNCFRSLIRRPGRLIATGIGIHGAVAPVSASGERFF